MLLVIHNLPQGTRYSDVKELIQSYCGLSNVILDNLMSEGALKKVTIGVTDEIDGGLIVRKLDGLLLAGEKLQVKDMRHNKDTSYNTNRNTRWNAPLPNNPPPLLSQNTMLGQNMSQNTMLGQNMSQNMMGYNNPMSGPQDSYRQNPMQNNSRSQLNQNTRMMGQNPSIGSMGMNQSCPPPLLGPNNSLMPPTPLMGFQPPPPFTGPYYMSPQNSDYGNNGNGHQNVQYPRKDVKKNSEFPDTGSRRPVPDKSVPVWADAGSRFGERDRSERPNPRRTDRQYDSDRDSYNRVTPWVDPPYGKNDYSADNSFDRSYDRGQLYSRRDRSGPTRDSGTDQYQRSYGSRQEYRRSPPPVSRRPPRYSLRSNDSHGARSPPPKRFRTDYGPPKSGPTAPGDNRPKKNKNIKLPIEKIIDRGVVWRNQAAAELVKDMFTRIETNALVPQNVAFQKMKIAVRNRLMIVLNNKLQVKANGQMELYRRRFKVEEDQCLYNRIIRYILHNPDRNPKAAKIKDEDSELQSMLMEQAKPIVKLTPAPVEEAIARIPKYPQGDKAAYKLQKKQFKDEMLQMVDEDVDNDMSKAINAEIEAIKDIVLAESVDPTHDGEVMFVNRIHESDIMDEVKKMIGLNVAKRILNLNTIPLIRILGQPKPPKKAPLEDFLRDKGVISLKKSDRKPMYIATCDTYENFDKLCAMKEVFIDDIKVLFKPMNLTPPLEKVKFKKKTYSKLSQAPGAHKQILKQENDDSTPLDIKQEVKTPVKCKEENTENVEIKTEVATPEQSIPASRLKEEIMTPIKKCEDEVAKQEPANDGTEDDHNEMKEDAFEDTTELNEDDLEDY